MYSSVLTLCTYLCSCCGRHALLVLSGLAFVLCPGFTPPTSSSLGQQQRHVCTVHVRGLDTATESRLAVQRRAWVLFILARLIGLRRMELHLVCNCVSASHLPYLISAHLSCRRLFSFTCSRLSGHELRASRSQAPGFQVTSSRLRAFGPRPSAYSFSFRLSVSAFGFLLPASASSSGFHFWVSVPPLTPRLGPPGSMFEFSPLSWAQTQLTRLQV